MVTSFPADRNKVNDMGVWSIKSIIADENLITFPSPKTHAKVHQRPRGASAEDMTPNEESTKRRQKPRAVISCDAMTTTRDGVLEF